MSLNKRLDKNVAVSKFLDLIKEADDGGLLKPVEYVQLEQLMCDNLSKVNVLNKLVNKLITESSSFKIDELDRYKAIVDKENVVDLAKEETIDEDSDLKIKQLEQNLNLIKNQKELLECELMKLYSLELDEELIKERENLSELRLKLEELFCQFKPLLSKREDFNKTRLDQQILNRLNKLKDKKLEVDQLIESIIMHVDLNLNKDKLIRLIEKEYSSKLIQVKLVLESLKQETDFILKIHRTKLIKNTIWKSYLKEFKDEISNEENLITSPDDQTNYIQSNKQPINFNEFKEFLNLSRNDLLDELLLKTKTELRKHK